MNKFLQIIKLLNSIKKGPLPRSLQINNCNENFLKLIHFKINDGVYKCGFARNQSSYEKASKNLFMALDLIEKKLEKNCGNWIFGEDLTRAIISSLHS